MAIVTSSSDKLSACVAVFTRGNDKIMVMMIMLLEKVKVVFNSTGHGYKRSLLLSDRTCSSG